MHACISIKEFTDDACGTCGGLRTANFPELPELPERSLPQGLSRKFPRIPPDVSLPEADGPFRMMADVILHDFGSISGAIFVVFRGCIAQAAWFSARIAEPLFLPTGAALSRIHRLWRNIKNRPRSTKNRSGDASRTSHVTKIDLLHDLALILVASARSRTLLGTLFGAPGRLWRVSGLARDVPGSPENVPKSLPARLWSRQGIPKGSPDRF